MDKPIELEDMKVRRSSPEAPPARETSHGPRLNVDADQEQAVALWVYVTATLISLLAILMIVFPKFLLYISEVGVERRNILTPLESFLALHSGILLVALAAALLFNVPTTSAVQALEHDSQPHPLLLPLTAACALVAFLSYNTTSVGSLAMLVFFGSATIAVWGMWTILFAGSSYISRKTGADKRTSRFLFGNKAAASSQKKDWKRQRAVKA